MKGWLADRRIRIPYSTAMRYKKLAQRLRQILSLDDRLPLEWLIEGLPAGQTLPADLADSHAAGVRRLSRILRGNRSLAALTRYAEKELGIVRVVAIWKAARRGKGFGTPRKTGGFSVISRGQAITITPARLDGTRTAIRRLMEQRNPPPGSRHLRNRLGRWLASLPAAPHTPE